MTFRSFRRTLRIFPPYYFLLVVVFAAAALRWLKLEPSDYWYTLTYTFNFKGTQPTWWVGHTWSLAVEEQFYLLWPLVVKLCGKRTIQLVALFWFALGPIGRAVLSLAPQPAIDHWYMAFPFVADPIAAGALLSFWLRDDRLRSRLERQTRQPWLLLAPLTVLGIASLANRPHFFPHPVILSSLLGPVSNVCIALVVGWAALGADGAIWRVLNSRLMVAIGVLSYSLYLWQMLFLNPTSISRWMSFPLNLAWVAAAALLSYTLIERPFNRFRHRRPTSMQTGEALATVPVN